MRRLWAKVKGWFTRVGRNERMEKLVDRDKKGKS